MLIPSNSKNAAAASSAGGVSEMTGRGAFVVLEGIDRSGKTSQCKLLLQRLLQAGLAATSLRFPNRTTATGRIINDYLQSSSSSQLDDRAIHLLFSANRWEAAHDLQRTLVQRQTTVICDRYAYSGVAFSSAKVVAVPSSTHNDEKENDRPLLSLDWCQAPDRGLPAPDCVIFLQLSPEQAEQRGGYGEERYEKRDMQVRVRQRFAELQRWDEQQQKASDTDRLIPAWHVVDAAQSLDQVQSEIWDIVQSTVAHVAETDKPLGKLWERGTYEADTHDDALEEEQPQDENEQNVPQK